MNDRAMLVIETPTVPDLVTEAFEKSGSELPFVTNSVGCHLEGEIEFIDPVTILTIGDEGLFRVSGERGSEGKAGLWMEVTHYRGYPLLVLPNFDPKFIEENPHRKEFFNEIVDDFVKVWQYSVDHTTEDTWRYARP